MRKSLQADGGLSGADALVGARLLVALPCGNGKIYGGQETSGRSMRLGHACPGRRGASSGVTLIEMLVVVGLISLMIGIAFPAITSGIDSLRLNGATNGVVSFLDYGLSRAERRQQLVEITILKADNSLEMRSSEPGFFRKMQLPDGVSIVQVLPQLPPDADADAKRDFLLYPGGTVPAFGLELINRRKVERVVRVDPITGVPHVESPPANE